MAERELITGARGEWKVLIIYTSSIVYCNMLISMFFHQDIDFDLTNLANILDIPGLRYV